MNRPDDAEYRAGLSPLARGTQRPCAPGSGCVRFIPAGAGNTQRECAGFNWTPVYPRWRGEHSFASCKAFYPSGLSPLARGTQELTHPAEVQNRFIPAGAGNTFFGIAGLKNYGGLSPLARGTPRNWAERLSVLRFIPAGAGNTRWRRRRQILQTVYPRWRGEHEELTHRYNVRHGLSPLARGTHSFLSR